MKSLLKKSNILPILAILYLLIITLLDKTFFGINFMIVLLLSAIVLKRSYLIILATLSNILYWLTEYTNYLYLDRLFPTTLFLASIILMVDFIHNKTKLFENKNEKLQYYISRILDYLKVFFIPGLIYGIGYAVIFFISILNFELLSDIAVFANNVVYILLVYKNLLNLKDNKGLTKLNWFKNFMSKVFIPINVVLMGIVALESIYFMIISSHLISYHVELGIFVVFIINNIFVSSFIDDHEPIINKIHLYLEITMPIFFTILILKNQYSTSYIWTSIYSALFTVLYILWRFNKLNKKTFLYLASSLYLLPVFGFISNPIIIAIDDNISIVEAITRTEYSYNNNNYIDYDEIDIQAGEDNNKLNNELNHTQFYTRYSPEQLIFLDQNNKSVIIDDQLEIYIEDNKLYKKDLMTNEISEIDFRYNTIGYQEFDLKLMITDKSVVTIDSIDLTNDNIDLVKIYVDKYEK